MRRDVLVVVPLARRAAIFYYPACAAPGALPRCPHQRVSTGRVSHGPNWDRLWNSRCCALGLRPEAYDRLDWAAAVCVDSGPGGGFPDQTPFAMRPTLNPFDAAQVYLGCMAGA